MFAPFSYDRRFTLSIPPGELWSILDETDRYVEWWSWLRVLEGGGLRPGAVARCVVRAPLAYSLHFTVRVDELVPASCVVTWVAGDLEGPARLDIEPAGDGCEARLAWELHLRARLLRSLSAVGRPAMRWAHDRIVDVGLVEFRRYALNGRVGT